MDVYARRPLPGSDDEAGACAIGPRRTGQRVTDARDSVLAEVVPFDQHHLLLVLASSLGHGGTCGPAMSAGTADTCAAPTGHEHDGQ
jgi:hypothetical protein